MSKLSPVRKNILFFVGNAILFFSLWFFLEPYPLEEVFPFFQKSDLLSLLTRIGIVALLCAPFTVGRHIFTVLGSAVNERGDIYSLFSFYQKSIQGNTIAGIFAGVQYAKSFALVLCGISLAQKAGNAGIGVGVSFYQHSDNYSFIGIGVSFYQRAVYRTHTIFGISVYQRVGEQEQFMACFNSRLEAREEIKKEE